MFARLVVLFVVFCVAGCHLLDNQPLKVINKPVALSNQTIVLPKSFENTKPEYALSFKQPAKQPAGVVIITPPAF